MPRRYFQKHTRRWISHWLWNMPNRLLLCWQNSGTFNLPSRVLLPYSVSIRSSMSQRHVRSFLWYERRGRLHSMLCWKILLSEGIEWARWIMRSRLLLHLRSLYSNSCWRYHRHPLHSWRLLWARFQATRELSTWQVQPLRRKIQSLWLHWLHRRLLLQWVQQPDSHWQVLCWVLLRSWILSA